MSKKAKAKVNGKYLKKELKKLDRRVAHLERTGTATSWHWGNVDFNKLVAEIDRYIINHRG